MLRGKHTSSLRSFLLTFCALALLGVWNLGCGSAESEAQVSDAETRIGKLLRLYQAYVQKNQKGPPNEEALRQFAQKLTTKEREDYAIGEDWESMFTSPRDNQKFVIKYNVKLDPSQNKAIAWEATGKDGMRYTALSIGYIVEYDETTLKDYKK